MPVPVPAPTLAVVDRRADEIAASFAPRLPGCRLLPGGDEAAARRAVAEADAVITLGPRRPPVSLKDLPRIRWVQALSTGTDHVLPLLDGRPDIVLTSTRGMHGPPVSELALALMIALARGLPQIYRRQSRRVWRPHAGSLITGKVAGIAGIGVIGTEIARKCRAFDMRTVGFSSAVRDEPHLDEFHRYDELPGHAPRLDFLVLVAPLTPATRHLVDRRVLSALRRDAYLVNVARGGIVDQQALEDHLARGLLAGAGLDTFAEEPLPAGSPLWDLPNVIITPHTAGDHQGYLDRAAPIVIENVDHFRAGRLEEMINLVRPPGGRGGPVG